MSCVHHRQRRFTHVKKTFSADEVDPWPVGLVNSWMVVTMSPSDLVDVLELPWGWVGPPDGDVAHPAKWKSSLITAPMVRELLAAKPWIAARVQLPPVSFKLVGWFGELANAYTTFDQEHAQALWEATHCLLISKEQARTSPFF